MRGQGLGSGVRKKGFRVKAVWVRVKGSGLGLRLYASGFRQAFLFRVEGSGAHASPNTELNCLTLRTSRAPCQGWRGAGGGSFTATKQLHFP